MTKLRISLFVTLSAFTGLVLADREVSSGAILPLLGTFLLAAGSCALNQYQERRLDGSMERTRNRPLPSGRLTPGSALGFSSFLILSGLFVLSCQRNLTLLALGLFAVVWYNGLYTYLKRKTAFAVLPGALVGVVPPLLGWVSGGGRLSGPSIWGIGFFLLMWQVPHFWILLYHILRRLREGGTSHADKDIFTRDRSEGSCSSGFYRRQRPAC